jgi:enoyl-CoA hydratase/carnithine racemase
VNNKVLREDDNHICTISFNRPDKKNALDADTLFSMGDILSELKTDSHIRVVVIRGSGDKIFSSGVDLSGGPELMERTIKGLEYCLDSLISYPSPVIAMISGPAIGAALDISMISDFRIASDRAMFGVPLVRLGRIYYYTAIQRITNLLGLAAAKELLLIGKLIDAKRAMEIGLVNQVVSPEQLADKTYSLAKDLAEGAAPLSVRATKSTIHKILEYQAIAPEIEGELKALADTVNSSEDGKEGVRAMLEKRKPMFLGK